MPVPPTLDLVFLIEYLSDQQYPEDRNDNTNQGLSRPVIHGQDRRQPFNGQDAAPINDRRKRSTQKRQVSCQKVLGEGGQEVGTHELDCGQASGDVKKFIPWIGDQSKYNRKRGHAQERIPDKVAVHQPGACHFSSDQCGSQYEHIDENTRRAVIIGAFAETAHSTLNHKS